jgi:hypothetical protein
LYGVLGEHRSDAETLSVLVRRLAGDGSLSIRRKGYTGGPEMLRKGARELRLLRGLGCRHAIYNEKVAGHLDLQLVERKCPSFRPLAQFVRAGLESAPNPDR